MGSMLSVIDHASVLTILGNEFLRVRAVSASPPFVSSKFHLPVRFIRSNSPHSEDVATDTPSIWFSILQKDSIGGLRLRHVPDARSSHIDKELSATLGPGQGAWLIEAVGESHSEFWRSAWSFGRHWQVEYAYAPIDPTILDPMPSDLSRISTSLEVVLTEIAGYAKRNRLAHFAPMFEKGIEHLHTDIPLRPVIYGDYRADLDGCQVVSQTAKRLIGAARSAWSVFGTMGAWNDRPKDERTEEYVDLTERLAHVLTEAMIAATNSTCHPAAKIGLGQTLL